MKLGTALVLAALCAACGYHLSTATTSSLFPPTVKTIAIPAFANATTRYHLSDRLPDAIGREFIKRTRYRIISNPNTADIVIHGSVLSYSFNPTIFDPTTGRASVADLHVFLALSIVDRASGKTIFNRPRFE